MENRNWIPGRTSVDLLSEIMKDYRHALSEQDIPTIWLFWMDRYGNMVCMKKTLHIDEKLLQEARAVSHAATDTETVRMGLEALIRRAAHERLRALRGVDPGARDVPRRRGKLVRKRRGA